MMKHSKTFLYFTYIGILLTINSCDETPSSKNRQPMTLKMDIPKPQRLPKSLIKTKVVPHVEKSDMDFSLKPNETDNPTSPLNIKNMESCLEEVTQLETIKNRIQTHGGLWGSLEKTENLKIYSPVGMQIDSKINKIVYAFRHLCETAKGLNYSPLAKFILENLREKSEDEFKRELIAKGETKADIDIYINYGQISKNNKDRSIRYSAIQFSINKARLFIEHYQSFYNRLQDIKTKSIGTIIPDLMAFLDALDLFLSKDNNVRIAVKEDFEKPFWVIDGDM